MKKYLLVLTLLSSLCFISCHNSSREQAIKIISQWENRMFFFTDQALALLQDPDSGEDTVSFVIVSYMDASVCTSCRINAWKEYVAELYIQTNGKVRSMLILSPDIADEEMSKSCGTLSRLLYYIDENNEMLRQNSFSGNDIFNTFLMNEENKVLAIGNPITNMKIRKLFLKKITGREEKNIPMTNVCFEGEIQIGEIAEEGEYTLESVIKNCGKEPLVIKDVTSTCGCVSGQLQTDIVKAGESTIINIKISPTKAGHIKEKFFISCNVEQSPLAIKINGNAIKD